MINSTQNQKPEYTGVLQVKVVDNGAISYLEKGTIALWEHPESKYILRGTVTMNGAKYHVNLTVNPQLEEPEQAEQPSA